MERRRVLLLAGGSLSVALAGCSGGDNGTGNDTDNGNDTGNGNNTGNGNDTGNGNGASLDTLVAQSTGGDIWIGAADEQTFRDEALGFPPSEQVPEPLVIDATVGDGSWESTNIEFPPLDISGLLPPEFSEFDVEVGISAPEGFAGEFDPENAVMTLEGRLQIDVTIDGTTVNAGAPITATTGTSGALTGSFDADSEPMTATLVENEAIIDEETDAALINDFLNLPRENPMWMELNLEIERMTAGESSAE
jgi:hypothetical protein